MIQINGNALASTIIQALEGQRDSAIIAAAELTVQVATLKVEAEAMRKGLLARDAEIAELKKQIPDAAQPAAGSEQPAVH